MGAGGRGRATHPTGGATRLPKTPASFPPRGSDGNARRVERGIGARQLARRGLCVSTPCRHLSANLLQWTRVEPGEFFGHSIPPCGTGTRRSRQGKPALDRVHTPSGQTRGEVSEPRLGRTRIV